MGSAPRPAAGQAEERGVAGGPHPPFLLPVLEKWTLETGGKTDLFSAADLAALAVDLAPGANEPGTIGYAVATEEVDARTATS